MQGGSWWENGAENVLMSFPEYIQYFRTGIPAPFSLSSHSIADSDWWYCFPLPTFLSSFFWRSFIWLVPHRIHLMCSFFFCCCRCRRFCTKNDIHSEVHYLNGPKLCHGNYEVLLILIMLILRLKYACKEWPTDETWSHLNAAEFWPVGRLEVPHRLCACITTCDKVPFSLQCNGVIWHGVWLTNIFAAAMENHLSSYPYSITILRQEAFRMFDTNRINFQIAQRVSTFALTQTHRPILPSSP